MLITSYEHSYYSVKLMFNNKWFLQPLVPMFNNISSIPLYYQYCNQLHILFVPNTCILYLKLNATTNFLATKCSFGPIQLRTLQNIILVRVFKTVYCVTTYPYALFHQTSYFRLRWKQERERKNDIALWYKAKHSCHLLTRSLF